MRAKAEGVCKNCGQKYRRRNGGASFCSRWCYQQARRAARVNEDDGTARCAKCKAWKPIPDFVRGTGGPHSYCKPCSSTWFHVRRGTPPEERKPYREKYKLTEEDKKKNKRELNRIQHVRRRGAGPAPGKHDIGAMFCDQDARCTYCGVLLDGYHIEHKTPVSRGGTNDITNLHLTCARCNLLKRTMTHEEFLVSKKRPVRRVVYAK